MNMYYELDASVNQVSIYTGRGMLIESQGPSWFIGGGSEHSVLYQYQLLNAKDVSHCHDHHFYPVRGTRPPGCLPALCCMIDYLADMHVSLALI